MTTQKQRDLDRWARMVAAGEWQQARREIEQKYSKLASTPKTISEVKDVYFSRYAGAPSEAFLAFWRKWKKSKRDHPSAKGLIEKVDSFIEHGPSGDVSNKMLARFQVMANKGSPGIQADLNGNRALAQSLRSIPPPFPAVMPFKQKLEDSQERKRRDNDALSLKMNSDNGFVNLNGHAKYLYDRVLVEGLASDDMHHMICACCLASGQRFSTITVFGQYEPVPRLGRFWIRWTKMVKVKDITMRPFEAPLLCSFELFSTVLQRARALLWRAYGVSDAMTPAQVVSRTNGGFNAWIRQFFEADPVLLDMVGWKERGKRDQQDGGAAETRSKARRAAQTVADADPSQPYLEPIPEEPVQDSAEPPVEPAQERQKRVKQRASRVPNVTMHTLRSLYLSYTWHLFNVRQTAVAWGKRVLGHQSESLGALASYLGKPLQDPIWYLAGSEGFDRYGQVDQPRKPSGTKSDLAEQRAELAALQSQVAESAVAQERTALLHKYLTPDPEHGRLLVQGDLTIEGNVHAKAFKKRKSMSQTQQD